MLNGTFKYFGGVTGGERIIFIYGEGKISPSPPFYVSNCN
jgi:hypothetical protein